MKDIAFLLLAFCAGVVVLAQTRGPSPPPESVRQAHTILATRCRVCHSGDAAQAGLKMDTREELLRGGRSGPALAPGDSAGSLLMLRITGKQGMRMPPAGPPLSPAEQEIIRRWIDEGAAWPAAVPSSRLAPIAPRNPQLPPGESPHPVDRFIENHFRRRAIPAPAPVSDALFARRVYLDLWGLPPTPEQLDAFQQDARPNKREILIDDLLAASGPYAEHWISFWNDLLRNDEGVVYHGERKSITTWLLGALRDNMPYDRMVAALLNPTSKLDPDGFLIGVNWRGVVSASQSAPMQASQNSAQVFLGMNLKCAACHDSFVNRWKLRDTYGLAAMFSPDPLELVRCDVPTGTMAEPRFPIDGLKVSFAPSLASRRRAVAEWFTSPENGRFARTLVNRYWRQLFGHGLVEPVDDMDAEPWHADLLDWLAWDFAAHHYDLRHLLRRIMTSRAYQLPGVAARSAEDSYLFRGPLLRRLSAEQFQDTISAVSGDWRVLAPRTATFASYSREWRFKSDPLSRALGRPIRDQVYTTRNTESTTLQALELTNGPLLSRRLERAAQALLGQLAPAPENVFDSGLMRGGSAAVDVGIAGAGQLWLVVEDVDSYDPARVSAGWVEAELSGPAGVVKLASLPSREPSRPCSIRTREGLFDGVCAGAPSMLSWDLAGKGFTHFRARAAIDESSRKSDISPALRFFVFTTKPETGRLVRVKSEPPFPAPPARTWTPEALVERLYRHLLARPPVPEELAIARRIVSPSGGKIHSDGVEDLLWALLMSPEFQFIH